MFLCVKKVWLLAILSSLCLLNFSVHLCDSKQIHYRALLDSTVALCLFFATCLFGMEINPTLEELQVSRSILNSCSKTLSNQ